MDSFRKWPLAERISLIVQLAAYVVVIVLICVNVFFKTAGDSSGGSLSTRAWNLSASAEAIAEEQPETEEVTTPSTTETSVTTVTTTVVTTVTAEEVVSETEKESETTISTTTTEDVTLDTEVTSKETTSSTSMINKAAPNVVTSRTTTTATSKQITQTTTTTAKQTTQDTKPEDTASSESVTTSKPKDVATTLEEVDNMPLTGKVGSAYTVTKSEFILLCNLLGREYGANWVSEAEKAKVIECVMNRVYSSQFPNTVRGVLGQRNQFTGSLALGDSAYRRNVTTSVKLATLNYLNGLYTNHGYKFYWGDGRRNHFRINY